ncbi:MAG: secretion system protein, partial [Novosphingobium sp.]
TELVIIVTHYLVNPVNANDIRLPTDGFSVPGAIEQLLLNSQNEGKKSSDRPKPTTSTPDATPDVGMAPSADAGTERAEKKDRRSRKNARSAAAAPGFNLN